MARELHYPLTKHNRNNIMKFEIPAGTTRLLEESKAEALKFGFSQVTTICLLFTAL